MDIQKCFEILGLDRSASLEKAKQAYKFQVKICHPDCFPDAPQQKLKAEEKLKEVNLAYEKVTSVLLSKPKGQTPPAQPENPFPQSHPGTQPICTDHCAGVNIILSLWSFLHTKFRQMDFKGIFEAKPMYQTSAERQRPEKYATAVSFNEILREICNGKGSRKIVRNMGGKCKRKNPTSRNPVRQTMPGTHCRWGARRQGKVGPIERIKPVSRVRGISRNR